jgi:cytochrome P450
MSTTTPPRPVIDFDHHSVETSHHREQVLDRVRELPLFYTEANGGHWVATSHALFKLCQDRDLLARVSNDLDLVPKVVEESLRRLTPARGIVRQAKEDVEIGGHRIPKGSKLFLMVQSANNDDAVFRCPERFDIDRDATEMRKSIHFGVGPHTAIGQWVARLDMKVAIETVLTRVPNLRLVPDQDIRVQQGMIFHRPEKLEFEWEV